MTEVDLSQLAIDRNPSVPRLRPRQQILTRMILPGMLVLGFLALVGWAARDWVFPPRDVRVTPVWASQSTARVEGTTLFNAAGWIEPRPTAIRVAALASGVVEKLMVVEDQAVSKGEPIAELIKDDAQLGHSRAIADRHLAEAGLRRAQAALVAAKTRLDMPVHLEASLAEADTALSKINTLLKNLPYETQRAESRLNFARRDYQRNVKASTSLSHREIDAAKTELETAQAHVLELSDRKTSLEFEATAIGQRRDAVNSQLQLLIDEIKDKDEADAAVMAAQARIQQMKVAEAQAELRLDRMTIRAPTSGRIYRLIGLPGSRVGDGVLTAMEGRDGGTIVTMYQPSNLQIRVDVRFEDIPKVSLNQIVNINNGALKQPISGRVLFISSEADIQKNTLQVKVAINSPPEFFKPEMLVDVTFLASQPTSDSSAANPPIRLFVPTDLIFQKDGNSFVWLADQSNGIAHRIEVTTGLTTNDGMTEIIKGLSLDSRIISPHIEGLVEGTRIRVTGEEPPRQ